MNVYNFNIISIHSHFYNIKNNFYNALQEYWFKSNRNKNVLSQHCSDMEYISWGWSNFHVSGQTYKKGISKELTIKSLLFSHLVESSSLWHRELKHARLPCPSLSPRVCTKSCQLSQWCHPTILSSVAPFPSCLQSLPASGFFLMSGLCISGGQGIGASAITSVLPIKLKVYFL